MGFWRAVKSLNWEIRRFWTAAQTGRSAPRISTVTDSDTSGTCCTWHYSRVLYWNPLLAGHSDKTQGNVVLGVAHIDRSQQ